MNIKYLETPEAITNNKINIYNKNFFSIKSYVNYFENLFNEKIFNYWKFPFIEINNKLVIPNGIYITSTQHTTNVCVYEFETFTIYTYGRKNIKKLYVIIPVNINIFNRDIETYYVKRVFDIENFNLNEFDIEKNIEHFTNVILEYVKNPHKVDSKSWSLFRKNLKIKNNKDTLSNKLFDMIRLRMNSTSVTSIEKTLPGINVLWNGIESEVVRGKFNYNNTKVKKYNKNTKVKNTKKTKNKKKSDNNINMTSDDLLNEIINNTSDGNIILKL